jgi:hypothetical protein
MTLWAANNVAMSDELPLNLGDRVNQAANFASDMTSIPSRNLTPLMTFRNWFDLAFCARFSTPLSPI